MSEDTRPRPTEKLIVRNFLSIRSAELEIKRFNVIIGTQAQGKSVLAKLIYFFRQVFNDQLMGSIRPQKKKYDFDRELLDRFTEFFPRHSWGTDLFELLYCFGQVEVKISVLEENNLVIEYSEILAKFRDDTIEAYNEISEVGVRTISGLAKYLKLIDEHVYQSELGYLFQESVFIPEGRVFFSNLQQIFQFLKSNTNMSPPLREFGEIYQSAKQSFSLSTLHPTLEEEFKNVLKGTYKKIADEDWIIENGRRTKLSNASSGQKESLPMLLVFIDGFLTIRRDKKPITYFVEEPEAHLFPETQKNVIEFMAISYNHLESTFFLTTHSPYVLTAINNLLYASELYESGDEAVRAEIEKYVPIDHFVRYDDLGAYAIEDGVLRSIVDEETQLIDATVIDAVSEKFDDVFDGLLEIGYRQKNGL